MVRDDVHQRTGTLDRHQTSIVFSPRDSLDWAWERSKSARRMIPDASSSTTAQPHRVRPGSEEANPDPS
eukprot:5391938-Pyramimonas_sp.AAC.1